MSKVVVEHNNIENQVYFVRGEKLMLDNDFVEIYGLVTQNT